MSSRLTIDSTNLRIRDVYALNTENGDYIQPASIPVIGDAGKIEWLSSIEFLSTISVPTLGATILELLGSVKPGLSSLSTVIHSTTTSYIRSTVAGLGSLPNGNDYISSTKANALLAGLAANYGYISATTLYDSFNHLGNMGVITSNLGVMAMFLGGQRSNLSRGYVSTMNPGQYRIYKSTLGLQGVNINASMDNTSIVTSATIDIGGYRNNIVDTSHLRLDIDANILAGFIDNNSYATTLSSFLYNVTSSRPIGDPVRVSFNNSSIPQGNVSFLLKSNDLTPFPTNLQLRHRVTIVNPASPFMLSTNIPQIGGIFATLDNTD
jgi:hypothetical protein